MNESASLATLLLGAASNVAEDIHDRMIDSGFDDLRPAHGFAFVRLTPHGATVTELAEHLSVTKQAASQLVDELATKGYVTRRPHPTDARAKLIVLTPRGIECTKAADQIGAELVAAWTRTLGRRRVDAMREDLSRVVRPGRIRPVW